MIDDFYNWIMQDLKTRAPIAVAVIGVFSAIIGGFFTVVVWPLLRTGLEKFWDWIVNTLSGKGFETRYLDWAINEHKFLPILPTTLLPVTGKQAQELDKLYVDLSVTDDPQKSQAIKLGDALKNNPYLVILGEPGAGKTTMLRFLTLTFARARRKQPSSDNLVNIKKEKVKFQDAHKRVKDEYGFRHSPLPVFVYLNRLRNVTNWQSGRSLLDVLRDEWKSLDNLRGFPTDFFENKLSCGECVFLFDAFDELGTQDARDAIAKHIGELASSAPAGNRFIVSSRIVGYNGQLSSYGFHTITIQRLSWDLVSQLVKNWYSAINQNSLADQLLSTLRTNSRIYDLAVNPMLLSLIALVQYVRRLIPDKRHVLYDECIKILVERRYAPPYVIAQYNEILPGDEAVRLLREIALQMHTCGLREVPRVELENHYIPLALKNMPMSKAANVNASDLLKNIEQRSQLLIERGFNDKGQAIMAFSHLTFQEYLSSVALKEATSKDGEAVISEKLINDYENNPEHWEEVALLYAAQLDGPQQQAFFRRIYPDVRVEKV